MRAAYNLLLHLILPLLPLRLWWRGRREPGYRAHIAERFGRYAAAPAAPVIWLHAVSVGETRAAEPLVKALRARYPDSALLITGMTAAGRATAESLYGAFARIVFLPYDYPWAVRAFLAHFRPRIGVLMETEVWPNLLRACRMQGVPVVLANARLSERSARGYLRAAALAREAFGSITAVAAQTEADAQRLAQAGARDVVVTGNLKFDAATPAADALARTFRERSGARKVALFASTREGEETLLLDALARAPLDALAVIVPRHPQRFDEVARLIEARGQGLARRSANASVPLEVRFVLGDSMGEMPAYYGACDVAFIGGSLLPLGGQNLIEACAVGTPVLVGPHTFNFADAALAAIAAGAALRIADADALIARIAELLADSERRMRMAEAGRAFVAEHRGATARVMALIARATR